MNYKYFLNLKYNNKDEIENKSFDWMYVRILGIVLSVLV